MSWVVTFDMASNAQFTYFWIVICFSLMYIFPRLELSRPVRPLEPYCSRKPVS
jgi:hypothetical protein